MTDLFQDSPLDSPASPKQLDVLVCPGFHAPSLTEDFVRSLPPFVKAHVIEAFPTNPVEIFQLMTQLLGKPTVCTQPVVAIGFSGGVVGIAGALILWQQQGGEVARLFAVDGWGVPLVGVPICRLSHDAFTHWSSLPLGAGETNFYADPPVDHLDLWGLSSRAAGWQVNGFSRQAMMASEFLKRQLIKIVEAT